MSDKKLTPQQEQEAKDKRTKAKAEKFEELAVKRVNNVIKQIRNVRKLSNRNSYVFTDMQVGLVIKAIAHELTELQEAFTNPRQKVEAGFSFKQEDSNDG